MEAAGDRTCGLKDLQPEVGTRNARVEAVSERLATCRRPERAQQASRRMVRRGSAVRVRERASRLQRLVSNADSAFFDLRSAVAIHRGFVPSCRSASCVASDGTGYGNCRLKLRLKGVMSLVMSTSGASCRPSPEHPGVLISLLRSGFTGMAVWVSSWLVGRGCVEYPVNQYKELLFAFRCGRVVPCLTCNRPPSASIIRVEHSPGLALNRLGGHGSQ